MLPNNLTDKEYAAFAEWCARWKGPGSPTWEEYSSWESISRKIQSGVIKRPQKKSSKRIKWHANGLDPRFILESRPGPDAGPKRSLFHLHPGVLVLRLGYRGSELRDEFGYGYTRFWTLTKKFAKSKKIVGRDNVYPFEVMLFLLKSRLKKMPKEQRTKIAECYWTATESIKASKNIRALRAVLKKYRAVSGDCLPKVTTSLYPKNMLF